MRGLSSGVPLAAMSAPSESTMASIPGAISLSGFPPEPSWVVNCGIGLTIVFGNPTTVKSEQIGRDGKAWLTYVPIPKQVCEKLSPIIGKEIQAINQLHIIWNWGKLKKGNEGLRQRNSPVPHVCTLWICALVFMLTAPKNITKYLF